MILRTDDLKAFRFLEIICIRVLSDDSIVACERDDTDVRLNKYSILGSIIQSINLERIIDDIEVITADGKECVALADW